jgi:hypothetical protein
LKPNCSKKSPLQSATLIFAWFMTLNPIYTKHLSSL